MVFADGVVVVFVTCKIFNSLSTLVLFSVVVRYSPTSYSEVMSSKYALNLQKTMVHYRDSLKCVVSGVSLMKWQSLM